MQRLMKQRNMWTGITIGSLAVCMTVTIWFVRTEPVEAHCQVPCGIYNDPMRIVQLHEDAETIAKAIHSIRELAGRTDPQSLNQLNRWVSTKEDHASHIIERMANYFLAQRVKPVSEGSQARRSYLEKLASHHKVIVLAMKTKQNCDPRTVDDLHHAIEHIGRYYQK